MEAVQLPALFLARPAIGLHAQGAGLALRRRQFAADVVWRRNPLAYYREYRKQRGMSVWHDWHDWLGGFPFEVAKPERILDFYRERGFTLTRLSTCGGSVGCNEFVFARHETR